MEALLKTINALSNDDFEALLVHINRQKKKRARDILAEAQRQARRFNKDLEVSPVSQKIKKLQPKYAHPNDSARTWSGMGRKPEWFRQYIDKGGNEKDLLIK